MGTASVGGVNASDFALSSDNCSGSTIPQWRYLHDRRYIYAIHHRPPECHPYYQLDSPRFSLDDFSYRQRDPLFPGPLVSFSAPL